MRPWIVLAIIAFFYLSAASRTFLPWDVACVLRWASLGPAVVYFSQLPRRVASRHLLGPDVCIAFVVAILLSLCSTAHFTFVAMKILAQSLVVVLLVGLCPSRCASDDWSNCLGAVKWMASASTVASLLLGTEISGSGRLGGLSNPNTIACIAMIAAVLLLWDLGQGHHWRFWQTVTTVALLLICLLVLIKTGSRASQAGTAIAMVVVAATSPRNVRIGVLGLFGMMLALIVYQGDAGRLSSRLSSRWLDEGLFTTRDYVWDSSIKSWTEEPWFGHGFGVSSIGREWDGSVLASGMVRDGAGYVGFLESVGVCGSIALTIVFAGVLSRTWTLMRHRHFADTKWLTSMKAFGLFLALATQHVGEPWMIGPGSLMNFTFWLSVGAVFGCSQADYSARTASSRAPPLRANVVN